MTPVVIRCDGAPLPGDVSPGEVLDARTTGAVPSLTLRVEPVSDAIAADVPPLASDLVRIAAYAYWADQMVGRGGATDVFGDSWSRDFCLLVPVSLPEVWEQPRVSERLGDVLAFASGDRWTFRFSRGSFPERMPLEGDAAALRNYPDCVVLFSGGADSCATVIEATAGGRRPALVSHAPVRFVGHRQDDLRRHLREVFPSWHFPHSRIVVNKAGIREKDSSQRSRAFLYAALGTAVASALAIQEVMLADNGVVSVNLPINGQVMGTKATRSTHPKFLWLFNLLLAELLPRGPRVNNPLWSRTKAEVMQIYKESSAASLLEETNSCAHARGLPKATPHCGVCSQCIDRRFGSMAAGLADFDPAERYVRDVFTRELEGTMRQMVEGYVNTMRGFSDLEDEDLVLGYPELGDCAYGAPDEGESRVRELCRMLRRQGAVAVQVLDQAITLHSHELAANALPSACLLRAVIGGAEVEPATSNAPTAPESPSAERPSGQPRLSREIEDAYRRYGLRSRKRIEIVCNTVPRGGTPLRIDGRPVVLPRRLFRLFLRLVLSLHQTSDGYVARGNYEGGGLADEGYYDPSNVDRVFSELRGRLGDVRADDGQYELIEVDGAGQVRLSVHHSLVQTDWLWLAEEHPDGRVRTIAANGLQLVDGGGS